MRSAQVAEDTPLAVVEAVILEGLLHCLLEALLESLNPLDVEGIVERIQGLEKRFRQAMEDTLEDHGLNYGEWRVLCNLHSSHDRTRTPGELSAKLELSSGAMTNRIDRLEADGLVERKRDPDDRRGVRVELTEAGNSAWVESTNTQAIKEKLIAGALTKAEQHQLNTLLRKLMLSFDNPPD